MDHTCASWRDVQNDAYSIDYSKDQAALSADDKIKVNTLIEMQQWAFYAYTADKSDTLLQDFQIFEDAVKETKVILGYDPISGSIITSWRGSANIMNWLEDFDFVKVDYYQPGCNDCQVHKGFYNSYSVVIDKLYPAVQALALKYPTAPVVVTGHSLGGAQATLCAADYQVVLNLAPHLYNYGSPRVGTANFVDWFNALNMASALRGVYRNDPVPTVPFVDYLEYEHIGTEVHFYDCYNYLVYPQYGDEKALTDLFAAGDHEGYKCLQVSGEAKNRSFMQ